MGELKLAATYVLPFAIVTWLWLGSASIKIKILITLFLPVFYFFHWTSLQSIKGWPVKESLPSEFQLLAADIDEPAQSESGKGHIHLWIRTQESIHPRAFVLPYTRSLHEQIHHARQRIDDGHMQIGNIRTGRGPGGGVDIGNGRRLEFQNRQRKHLPPKSSIKWHQKKTLN